MKVSVNIDLEDLKKEIENSIISGDYYNYIITFDIETTSFFEKDGKRAAMYIYGFSLNGNFYVGRKWSNFIKFIDFLNSFLTHKIIIWVHNLSYEFQFFRKLFKWDETFFISERKIAKALIGKVEFRCTYILSNKSLDDLAKGITIRKIRKLKGDLNYDLPRNYLTPLTKKEMKYLCNDVQIVYYYIKDKLQYETIDEIPLTKTGYVRKSLRKSVLPREREKKLEYNYYFNLMQKLKLTPQIFSLLLACFQGGYTHASPDFIGLIENNVSSFDLQSAYPYAMCCKKYPMTPFKQRKLKSLNEFYAMLENNACIFTITLYNVTPKIIYDYYISLSKCHDIINYQEINGRVMEAEKITLSINEIDFQIINNCYDFDEIEISNFYYACKQYIPKAFIEKILEYYNDKTLLKGVKGKEKEYSLAKENVNSLYGMMVTNPIRQDIIINDNNDYVVKNGNVIEGINKYNNDRKRVSSYAWGVYVTAYIRQKIWNAILSIKNDYRYTDTDSIKCVGDHLEYFENENEKTMKEIEKVCYHYNIDIELFSPKGKTLGVWAYEETYTHFKTLGAKRYMYDINGKYQLTCAGVNKKAINYILSQGGYNAFNDELYIPCEHTGKLTHTYFDESFETILIDYLGNEAVVKEESYIHLSKADFSLSISESIKNFMFTISYKFDKI